MERCTILGGAGPLFASVEETKPKVTETRFSIDGVVQWEINVLISMKNGIICKRQRITQCG